MNDSVIRLNPTLTDFFLFCFCILLIPVVSFIIVRVINKKLVNKNKKKLPTLIFFPLTTILIGSLGFGYFFGYGWFIPYSLQPSYWEFKRMCELNELPNNKEKYNKILSYFDLSLDTLDWEELNKTSWKLEETNDNYKKNVFEYMLVTDWKQLNSRIEMQTQFLSNESKINRYNIKAIKAVYFSVRWRTKIYSLSGGTGLYLSEWILGCSRIVKSNLEVLDEKQRDD